MSSEYTVATERVDARPLAVVRARMTIADLKSQFGALLGKVYKAGLKLDGQNVFVYSQCDGGLFDIQFGVGVDGKFDKRGDVEYSETPAGEVVCATHWGDYSLMRPAHEAIQTWMKANNRKFSGTSWEVYGHMAPDQDPANVRTDIYYLLAG